MINIGGIVLAFIVIIVLVMRKFNIGLSLFLGSIIIGLSSGMNFKLFLKIFYSGLSGNDTMELAGVVVLISLLSFLMNETLMIDRLIKSIQNIFSDPRISLILIPSLLGALPVPGGAMLSAPMVNNVGRKIKLSDEQRMAVNLIYRHIWYFVFPFAPTLILAAKLAGLKLFSLILWQLPVTLIIGVVSFYFYFPSTDNLIKEVNFKPEKNKGSLIDFTLNGFPLLIAIIIPFVTGLTFALGLIAGALYVFIFKFRELRNNLTIRSTIKGLNLPLLLTILGIMVFKSFISYGNSLTEIANFLVGKGISPSILAVFLPGLVSFFTGSRPAAIGITFPLLSRLLGGLGMTETIIMYGASFFAYLVSPVHVCFSLTQAYFKVEFGSVYRQLAFPVGSGILTVLILSILT